MGRKDNFTQLPEKHINRCSLTYSGVLSKQTHHDGESIYYNTLWNVSSLL